MNTTVPMTLNKMCITATLLAFLFTPILEISAVAQVPIFCPMTIGMAIPHVMPPVSDRACSMPMDAAELWMMAVTPRPVRMPSSGLLKAVSMDSNFGESASGLIELLIRVMPYISMANPTRMFPISFFLLVLQTIIIMTPTSASIGENDSGFNILIKKLSLEMPIMLMIHAVTVVPMLEPMITPTVLARSMIPELTSPTSITVTADELCMAMVMPQPNRRPLNLLDVILFSMASILPPASFSRLCDI